MKDHYSAYVRQVGRELDLPQQQKKKLLHGLQLEIEEQLSENPRIDQFGNPKDIANTLLESVDPEERRRYHAVKLFRFRCAVVILGLLLAIAVGLVCYFDITEIKRADITVIQDTVPTQYSVDADNK